VLVAIVLLAVLVAVIAPSLMASLRAEETADLLARGQLVAEGIVAAAYVPAAFTNASDRARAWATADDRVATDEEAALAWRVWEVSPKVRPSLRVRFALRTADLSRPDT
jgi:hypothetical protein